MKNANLLAGIQRNYKEEKKRKNPPPFYNTSKTEK